MTTFDHRDTIRHEPPVRPLAVVLLLVLPVILVAGAIAVFLLRDSDSSVVAGFCGIG